MLIALSFDNTSLQNKTMSSMCIWSNVNRELTDATSTETKWAGTKDHIEQLKEAVIDLPSI